MRLAELRIFLFDRGEAIFPSRPQFNCAAVSSGGRRRSSPHGTSCSTSHVPYGVWEAEAGRPSKTVLSASSESLILLTYPGISVPRSARPSAPRSACLSQSPLMLGDARHQLRRFLRRRGRRFPAFWRHDRMTWVAPLSKGRLQKWPSVRRLAGRVRQAAGRAGKGGKNRPSAAAILTMRGHPLSSLRPQNLGY